MSAMRTVESWCRSLLAKIANQHYNQQMAVKITKNISLTRRLDQYIDRKVRSGRYQSASEVVREGLRLMEERDAALAQTRRAIEIGYQQAQRGEDDDGETVMQHMRRRLLKKLAGKRDRATTRSRA
jgi:antitoxin ParD1/3/4